MLKLTVIPRDSGAMGFSQQMPPPVELYEKDALLDRIAVCLAGRAAEELFMGCISSGETRGAWRCHRASSLGLPLKCWLTLCRGECYTRL